MSYTLYTKQNCGACDEAKNLLNSKGIPYYEVLIDVGQERDPNKKYATVAELLQLVPNARTVPQIFKNGAHIGGLDALRSSVNP
jgi:glutaredoxin 3